MKVHGKAGWIAGVMVLSLGAAVGVGAGQQPPVRQPLPAGQRLEARDGDRVIVEDDARVTIVRRRHARVRAVFNPNQRWLILLATYRRPDAAFSGRVDETFNFQGVSGDWPLPPRWEGDAEIEQYTNAGEGVGFRGVGIESPVGMVQLFGPVEARDASREPAAAAVLSYRGSGRAGGGGVSFDEAEQLQVAIATQNAERYAQLPSGTTSVVGGVR